LNATTVIEATWYFDCPGGGTVQSLGPLAEALGVRRGMALADALARVLARGHAVQAIKRGDSVHVEAPAAAGDASALRARLQEEVRHRRLLERQILKLSENEQRRISLELHDGLGQHLSGLAYHARSVADRLAEEQNPHADEVAWVARLLKDAVARTRALSRGLWPVSLERDSLPTALGVLAKDMEQMYGVSMVVTADPQLVVESSVAAHHLFRIVQEASSNAIRHGAARRIVVALEFVPPNAMLSITSDGKALDTSALAQGKGLGVVGMRLRADALGAELSLEPLAAGGAEVCVIWPMLGGRPRNPNPPHDEDPPPADR
jgi:signal transduction histidine kinase